MAVPSVGRGSPSPVRPAMAGCLGDIWTCREAVQHRTRGDIYTSSPVRRGPAVDGGDGASIDLSIHTYIHTYIHIYIYTRRYWWMHLDTRYIARRQQSTLLPPALAPLARTSLCPVVAPRWGLTPVPGDHSGPPPTGQYPGLPPSMVTAPGNAPRAHGLPRTGESEFPRPPLPAPALDPNPPNLPRPTGPPLAPPRSPRSAPPSPSAPGAALPGPRPPPPRPRLPALAFSTAALVPPGRARMRWPRATVPASSSVAVELRPPPRGPVTLPHAGRLIASLIDSPALVGPPSCAQTLPCPEMIPGGRVVHQRWATWSGASISGCQLAGSLRVCRGRAGPRVRHGGVPNLGLGVPNLGVAPP